MSEARERMYQNSRYLTRTEAHAFRLGGPSSGTWRNAGVMPAWHAIVEQQLRELLELKANWDSYGSRAPSLASANDLLDVLALVMNEDTPAPSVVPCSCGHFQAEWHINGVDLEIEVVTQTDIPVSYADAVTSWDDTFDFDFTELMKAVTAVGRVL